MAVDIERDLEPLRTLPDPKGWVRLEQVRKERGRLELRFGIHEENRGKRKIGSWRIVCSGVREAHIADFDGGGLALYPTVHPAARQYTARQAELRWAASNNKPTALGALYKAHTEAVNDWIPFDRCVSMKSISDKKCVCRGPDFLVLAYAKALRTLGEKPYLTLRGSRKSKQSSLRVLHFGDSFVVAAVFQLSSEGKI
jgi:hypothetical protein